MSLFRLLLMVGSFCGSFVMFTNALMITSEEMYIAPPGTKIEREPYLLPELTIPPVLKESQMFVPIGYYMPSLTTPPHGRPMAARYRDEADQIDDEAEGVDLRSDTQKDFICVSKWVVFQERYCWGPIPLQPGTR